MNETLANAVLNALSAHIAVLDASGTIVVVNAAWSRFACENSRLNTEVSVGANYLEVCEQAAAAGDQVAREVAQAIRALLQGEHDEFIHEYPCHAPDEQRWFVARLTCFKVDAAVHIVVVHEDITARKQAELSLQETDNTLRQVLEVMPLGVWILDQGGKIVLGNPASQKIWAGVRYISPEQFGEYKGWWLDSGKPIAAEEWAAARAICNGETSINEEVRIECFDGSEKIILNSAVPLYNPQRNIKGAVIVNQDITARKHAEQELLRAKAALEASNHELQQALARERIMARTDDLTGINNRRYFIELAGREFTVAQRYTHALSIMLFDIDRFKQVNDELGHQAGDVVLQEIVGIALQHLRDADTLARYGGEEFIVCLPDSTARQAEVVAERIRYAIEAQKIITRKGPVNVTISTGIAEIIPQHDDLERLIQRADQALYKAKDAGRNCTVIFS